MIWLLLEYELLLTDFVKRRGNDALEGRLARLEELGNLLRAPASEPLGDGMFELRANSKEGRLRVYYFFGPDVQQIAVVHAVVKKRRKADPSDIKLAKDRRARILKNQVRLNRYAVRS